MVSAVYYVKYGPFDGSLLDDKGALLECSICHNSLENNDQNNKILAHSSGKTLHTPLAFDEGNFKFHPVHQVCLRQWFERSISCPVCRGFSISDIGFTAIKEVRETSKVLRLLNLVDRIMRVPAKLIVDISIATADCTQKIADTPSIVLLWPPAVLLGSGMSITYLVSTVMGTTSTLSTHLLAETGLIIGSLGEYIGEALCPQRFEQCTSSFTRGLLATLVTGTMGLCWIGGNGFADTYSVGLNVSVGGFLGAHMISRVLEVSRSRIAFGGMPSRD